MTPSHRKRFKRVAKLLVALGYWFFRHIVALAYAAFGKKIPACGVTLYYHAIQTEDRIAFARQMDAVLRQCTPVSLACIPRLLAGRRYVAIAFDDGFENVVVNAIPELVKRNIPATLFVTANALGKLAEWWPGQSVERYQRIITEEELRQLPDPLVTIGSHTMTHPFLTQVDRADAERELRESRSRLEQILEQEVTLFSFPYGDFNDAVVEWCREIGYQRVFTSLPRSALRENDYVNGRVAADPSDWPLEFYLKLSGAYNWAPYASSAKRLLHLLWHFASSKATHHASGTTGNHPFEGSSRS